MLTYDVTTKTHVPRVLALLISLTLVLCGLSGLVVGQGPEPRTPPTPPRPPHAEPIASSDSGSFQALQLPPLKAVLIVGPIDGDTGQVGPGVAENLGLPHITDVRKIESIDDSGFIIVERLLEDGYVRLKTKLPVILTVVKEINEPRLPSLKGKMKARKAEVTVWTKDDLDVDTDRLGLTGSPTQVIKIFTPPKPSGGKILQGETKEVVAELLSELKQSGIPIGKSAVEKEKK